MLSREVDLWSLASIRIGDLLLWSKYLFALAFLLWAAGASRWRGGRYVFAGTLVLSTLGMLSASLPLARPYGLTDESGALSELAMPMVTAARGNPAEGWLSGERNGSPAYSLLLAALSGFEPEHLLSLYVWVPILAQLFAGLGLYAWGLSFEREKAGAISSGLAVFFNLMLGAHRLSFLEEPGTAFVEIFWLRPRIGFALGLLAFFFAALARSRSTAAFGATGALLAVLLWTEPRFGVLGAVVLVFAWLRTSGRQGLGSGVLVVLAVGLGAHALWLVPWRTTSIASDSWHPLRDLLSSTLDRGLVFVLGVYGIGTLALKRELSSALLSGTALASALLVVLSRDSQIFAASLGLAIALGAGLGASDALSRVGALFPNRAFLALFLACSLPWCFPYWWFPARMDSRYEASLDPISRQRLELAEWVRSETAPDSVFVAGPSYAPWIGALAGRRVLAVGALEEDSPRARAFQALVRGSTEEAVRTFGVTHVAWGRLDPPIDDGFFAERAPLREVHRQGRWVVVYEIPK